MDTNLKTFPVSNAYEEPGLTYVPAGSPKRDPVVTNCD